MIALIAVSLTAGCMQGNGVARSGFKPVNSNKEIDVSLARQASNAIFFTKDGAGVAYTIGVDRGSLGLRAYSGIIPGSDVQTPPTTGTATLRGGYSLYGASDIQRTDRTVRWTNFRDRGNLTLKVDFDKGTLTSSDSRLKVNGNFTGKALTGGVEYRGVSGQLKGLVGAKRAIGAFHGASPRQKILYTGGFVALTR